MTWPRWIILSLAASLALGIAVYLGARQARADGMIKCDSVHVVDGDTLHCNMIRVRLFGIDAPDFACKGRRDCVEDRGAALASKRFLEALTRAGGVFCKPRTTDKYGRTVAVCYAGGNDLGCALIRQGHAREWVRYSKGAYAGCAKN